MGRPCTDWPITCSLPAAGVGLSGGADGAWGVIVGSGIRPVAVAAVAAGAVGEVVTVGDQPAIAVVGVGTTGSVSATSLGTLSGIAGGFRPAPPAAIPAVTNATTRPASRPPTLLAFIGLRHDPLAKVPFLQRDQIGRGEFLDQSEKVS
jgi:hypothetical protein